MKQSLFTFCCSWKLSNILFPLSLPFFFSLRYYLLVPRYSSCLFFYSALFFTLVLCKVMHVYLYLYLSCHSCSGFVKPAVFNKNKNKQINGSFTLCLNKTDWRVWALSNWQTWHLPQVGHCCFLSFSGSIFSHALPRLLSLLSGPFSF